MSDDTSRPDLPDAEAPLEPPAAAGSPEAATTGLGETEPTATEPSEPKKKSPWFWVAIAAAVVLVLGAAIAYSSSSDSGGLLFFLGRGSVEVPLVVGQSQSEAENLITAAGLRVGQVSQVETLAVAPGVVVGQSPVATTKVKEDSAVDISVSAIPVVTVPNVVGQTQSTAAETLAEQGLMIDTIGYTFSDTPAGEITAQDPAEGTQAKVGSAVDITVSKGKQQGQVPNVVGLSESDAKSTLEGAGFKVTTTKSTSTDVPAGDVISQSPAAGTVTAAGSTVTIKVSTGPPAETAAPPSQPSEPSTPEKPKPPSEPEKTTVPDIVGMSVREASKALRAAGLKMNIEFASSSEYVLKVAKQDPVSGTSVDPGTAVTVTIGLPEFSFERPPAEPTTLPAPLPESPNGSAGVESTSGP